MAIFKFRKDGAEPAAPAPAAESLEAMRKRARHRLIGAAALVLLGVVGFPILFDSQPRPIDVNIAIEIPDKAKVAPLAASPAVVSPPQPEPEVTKAPTAERETVVVPAAEKMVIAADPVAPAPEKANPAPNKNAAPKVQANAAAPVEGKPDAGEAAKAQNLLDGKVPATQAGTSRYTVQVGAFADVQKARETRITLEKAGFKTYTQVINNADGRRIRVRVGPFTDKAEADKAAEKIKSLNLAAAVLTL
jgi:DedD protein